MFFKKIIAIAALLFSIANLQPMESPTSKYAKAKEYLKAHFKEKIATCPLENAEIIGFGGAHNRPEHYANIAEVVNILSAAQQSTFLTEGLEKGKLLDYKTRQWEHMNDSITIKGCDDTAENLKAQFEAIGNKVAELLADIKGGKSIDASTMLPSDQDLIGKRNKIFIQAILDELNDGKIVYIYFGEEHFDKDPEAQEFREFLAAKKSHVYGAQNQLKPAEQVTEETMAALSWLEPYIKQNSPNTHQVTKQENP